MQDGLNAIPDDESVVGMLHQYTTYQQFVAAMIAADRIHEDFPMTDLYLPYLPGARQDKPRALRAPQDKATGDVLRTRDFTLDLIDMVRFKTVHILDPHSDIDYQVNNLQVKTYSPAETVAKFIANSGYDGIIAADAGGCERAGAVARLTGLPLLHNRKFRDPITNALKGDSIIGLHKNEHYLVVDDICDGGGTFLNLADHIDGAGATADLYVTHGLFTKGAAGKLKQRYVNLYASDSLGYRADEVQTISMVENLMLRTDAQDTFHYHNIEEGKR